MKPAISVPNGSVGFDHGSLRLTFSEAKNFMTQGYRFCIRYVPNSLSSGSCNLIKSEADEKRSRRVRTDKPTTHCPNPRLLAYQSLAKKRASVNTTLSWSASFYGNH